MKYALLALLVAAFTCCKNRSAQPGDANAAAQPSEAAQSEAPNEVPPGFMDFYERFHKDSLYQISHITFPLAGAQSVRIDSSRTEMREIPWQAKDWLMQRLNFPPTDYLRQWQTVSDGLVIERIRARGYNSGLERRFAKQPNGEWELIYYSEMHELGQ